MIDRTRLQRLSTLLDEALDLDLAQRAGWLGALREREPALADEVGRLLRQADEAPDLPPTGTSAFGQWLGLAVMADDLAGRRLGAWELICKIGEGGMGQVWLARRADGMYEAQAAIKLLRSDLPPLSFAARFARERAVLARLNHPAIARLLDAGMDADRAYLVLEHVPGRSLSQHVRAVCPTVASRVRLLIRIAQAVAYAHAHLVVHRDLKPSNVLVTPQGEPKLLDFGIAGLLDDGEQAGASDITRQTGRGLTPGYSAPEQITGAPIGTAADVFSLGVMLFELLSGELPFGERGSARAAVEHAVLHGEPRRLSRVSPSNTLSGPGRPQDFERVRGDLEAVVATALRRDPAQRYGGVPALIDDLEHWLAHRPVSVRREDWRHRSRLWLRRHAVLAGAATLVTLSLVAGLAASTWQWRRAEAAARTSARVTDYLTELLAAASPDSHGGQWPTVLQLLESSRKDLDQKFTDDPDTRMQLLQVISRTYRELNRYDVAIPLAEQWVAMSIERHGPDDKRSLVAQLDLAHALQIQGSFDKAVALMEPVRTRVAKEFGGMSDEYQRLLYVMHGGYSRLGRYDDAERVLAEAGRITEAKSPPGSADRLSHLNHVQVLRVGQGRLREALAALRQTEPYWGTMQASNVREWLVLRRNTITVQARLGEYERIEERSRELMADADRILGVGNDLGVGMGQELARYFTDVGQLRQALAQREANLAQVQAAAVKHPATLLPLRAAVLLARGQAHAADAQALASEARSLLSELQAGGAALGYGRAEATLSLARLGLLLDDAALAADALGRVRGDAGLRLDRDRTLATRVVHLEGELARLQGDLAGSRERLQERLAYFDHFTDTAIVPAWVAALDLAYTQVLMNDPAAEASLQRAARHRPPALPAGHLLDAVAGYLAARLGQGSDEAAPVRAALRELARVQGRPGQAEKALRGSLGGAFI